MYWHITTVIFLASMILMPLLKLPLPNLKVSRGTYHFLSLFPFFKLSAVFLFLCLLWNPICSYCLIRTVYLIPQCIVGAKTKGRNPAGPALVYYKFSRPEPGDTTLLGGCCLSSMLPVGFCRESLRACFTGGASALEYSAWPIPV